MMNLPKREVRLLVFHEFKLGHNASETSANINRTCGERSTSDRTVRMWLQTSLTGDESFEDEEGRERACSPDNEQMKAVVEQNPHRSVRETFQTLGVGASRHLQSIGKVKKLDNWSLINSISIKN